MSKRLEVALKEIDNSKQYSVVEAVDRLKRITAVRFDETVELVMNLGVDPRHSDQIVRGLTSLPNGTGKTVSVAVFAKGDKATEAKEAGADIVGDDDLVQKVRGGDIDFDRCIATPDMMAVVGGLGKVLGPKGLMPNPKLGTVTMDVAQAVKAAKSGQIEYRAEKNGIVHVGVGKVSFDSDKLKENIYSFFETILQAKPSGAKGSYVKKISLCSTMSPSVAIDISELSNKKSA